MDGSSYTTQEKVVTDIQPELLFVMSQLTPKLGERPCPNKLTIWKQKGFTGPGHLLINPPYP